MHASGSCSLQLARQIKNIYTYQTHSMSCSLHIITTYWIYVPDCPRNYIPADPKRPKLPPDPLHVLRIHDANSLNGHVTPQCGNAPDRRSAPSLATKPKESRRMKWNIERGTLKLTDLAALRTDHVGHYGLTQGAALFTLLGLVTGSGRASSQSCETRKKKGRRFFPNRRCVTDHVRRKLLSSGSLGAMFPSCFDSVLFYF